MACYKLEMELETTTNVSINHQLRNMVAEYLHRHPGLTLNALATRSGVAATTLRRLMQEESKNELAPHSVLNLISYIFREKKISKLLNLIDGPVAALLKKCFDQFIFSEESSQHKLDHDLNEILKDEINYVIYKLAANRSGTTIEYIKDMFGLNGIKKLEKLLDLGVISRENETLHAQIKNFTLDLKLAHQHAHTLVDQYRPEDVSKGFNLFYSLSESLNADAIKAIKDIERDAVKKVFDIMNSDNSVGDIPYFSLFISDILGHQMNQSNQGVLQ